MKKTHGFSKFHKIGVVLVSVMLGFMLLSGCDLLSGGSGKSDSGATSGGNSTDTGNVGNNDNPGDSGNSGNQNNDDNQENLSIDEAVSEINGDEVLKDNIEIVKNADGTYGLRILYQRTFVYESDENPQILDLSALAPDSGTAGLSGYADLLKLHAKIKEKTTVAADSQEKDAVSKTTEYRGVVSRNQTLVLRMKNLLDAGKDRLGNAVYEKLSEEIESAETAPEIMVKKGFALPDNANIYVKMTYLDSPALPSVDTANDDRKEVAPGVFRISKNGRTALDFTSLQNGNILIDFDGLNQEYDELKSFYRGGFVLDGTTVTLANTRDAKISGVLYPKDFEGKNSKTLSIFDKISELDDDNLPEAQIISLSAGNIYGTGIDKMAKKYYNSSKLKDYISINRNTEYDAREALIENGVQKPMFNPDNSYNPNADPIDAGFAAFLLSEEGVKIKNVIINGSWPANIKSGLTGTLINSVVDVDMSAYTDSELQVKGMLLFKEKMPKSLNPQGLTKVVEHVYNPEASYVGGKISYDISKLGDDQSTILDTKKGPSYYYVDEKFKDSTPCNGQAYIFNNGSYKSYITNGKVYSNAEMKKYGNDNIEPTGYGLSTPTGRLPSYPISRANNIKLTPVQKLLLDDQHIYG